MRQFDPNLGEGDHGSLIQGEVTDLVIAEYPEIGLSNHVVNAKKPFTVTVKWEVFGPLADMWLGYDGMAEFWSVELFAESIGGGPETTIAEDKTIHKYDDATKEGTPPARFKYEAAVKVLPNLLPEGNPGPGPSGLYRISASVFLNDSSPHPYDLIGFLDGPVIQVEDPT